MVEMNKKTRRICVIVLALIIVAAVCRFVGNAGILPKLAGLIRSGTYLGLYAAWGISLRGRIIQPQVRRYLTAIAGLMVFWFLLRTCKFHFIPAGTQPDLSRYLWYLYYLPMLFIPLLAVFVSLSLGEPEQFRLPKWVKLLYLPTALLVLLVLTNDLHQMVFTFPPDAAVWTDDNYHHAVGYYLAAGWSFICALITLGTMLVKCRVAYIRKRIWLPLLFISVQIGYTIVYVLDAAWLHFIAGDVTAVNCLMYAATLESCIQCGLIASNSRYDDLFDASTVAAQITDEDYRVCLSSETAVPVTGELLRRTESGPVMLEGGIRLSGAPIRGGHVVWQEDVSGEVKRLAELQDLNETLEDKNVVAREEYESEKKRLSLMESNRLYNRMQLETADKIEALCSLLAQAKANDDPEVEKALLCRMAVMGAYVKRRNNLLFVSESEKRIPADELAWSVRESLRCLRLRNVNTGYSVALEESLSFADAVRLYDTMEMALELCMDTLSELYLKVGRNGGELFLTLIVCCQSDLSSLASPELTVARESEQTWELYFHFPEKAGEPA